MKYLTLLMIIAFVWAPVWAEEEQTSNEPQNETAKTYMAEMQIFADAYLTPQNVPGFDKDGYLAGLNATAKEIAADADRSGFNPKAYISDKGGVKDKVDNMLSTINDYKNKAECKEDYLKEIANFFLKEYLTDMKEGTYNIPTSDYLADIDSLKQNYVDRLKYLNEEKKSNTKEYDPSVYLDKTVGRGARAAKIDIVWAGVNDHWLSYKLSSIVDQFKSKFGYDKVAQADFNWLQKLWPQSSEVHLMNASYNDNVYGASEKAKQTGQYANAFYVNEFGKMMNYEQGGSTFYDGQFTATQMAPARSDGTYNNRGYGYKYHNGTFTTIKVTTNGREYKLQESIYTSPIVLDMDGDGKLEASNGKSLPHGQAEGKVAEFDMDGDGFIDLTEWVGPNDGLLMVYSRGEEVSANNLFGNAGGFYHGYEKLSLLDKNNDSKLEGEELSSMCVWQDKNGNAKVDAGEVSSLDELGITSIDLRHNDKLESSFVQKGASKKMWDWFPTMYRVKRNR